jgi:RNA polymerase sigma factor (TIGR02999 family)
MRRILTDHARHRNALKENSGAPMIPLRDDIAISGEQYVEALEIDDLLVRLAEFRPRAAKVVEMRFFAGLGEREIAEALGVHVRTIRRDWEFAQAWLHSEIKPD